VPGAYKGASLPGGERSFRNTIGRFISPVGNEGAFL
jgi:hypothetical protein